MEFTRHLASADSRAMSDLYMSSKMVASNYSSLCPIPLLQFSGSEVWIFHI